MRREDGKANILMKIWDLLDTSIPLPFIFRHRPAGIIYREARAAISAVTALAGLIFIGAVMVKVGDLMEASGGSRWAMPTWRQLGWIWQVVAIIVAFLLGVLCGAEEEENGTADFVRRLPIPRLRILAEKIAGSCIAFFIWVILTHVLVRLVSFFFSGDIFDGGIEIRSFYGKSGNNILVSDAAWWALLYFAGLAAGAWIGRVVAAAVVGGIGAVVYVLTIFLTIMDRLTFFQIHEWPLTVMMVTGIGILIALALTVIRYATREGR